MIIRKFRKQDADKVSKLIIHNLRTINAKDHPKEVIDMLVSHNTPQKLIEKSRKHTIIVAEINNKIVGTGCLEKNRVRNVFVDTMLHKKGIGKKLMNKVEDIARNKNINRVYLTSSLYAEGFYRKLGYKKVRKYTEIRSEVPIDVIRMEKILNG